MLRLNYAEYLCNKAESLCNKNDATIKDIYKADKCVRLAKKLLPKEKVEVTDLQGNLVAVATV